MNEKALMETVNAIMTVVAQNNLDPAKALTNLCTSVQMVIQIIAIRYDENPEDIALLFSEKVRKGVKAPTGDVRKNLKELVKELLPWEGDRQ